MVTSRQVIEMAIAHSEPDWVPLDMGGMNISSISSVLLKKMLDHFDIPEPFDSSDIIQRIGTPPDTLKRILGIDTQRIGPQRIPIPEGFSLWEPPEHPVVIEDMWQVAWEMRPEDIYFHQHTYPLASGDLGDALDSYTFPRVDQVALTTGVRSRLVGNQELFCVLDRDCAGLFEMSQRLRGMQSFFMDLLLDTAATERLADALLEYKFSYWDAMLAEVGDEQVVVAEADDFGTDQSLLISPELIRQIYLPRLTQLISHIKKTAPNANVCFHSCGAIRPIIPDLIEAGVDMLNPVQYNAAGMDLKGLKRDFGKDLVFWGGCIDTTRILPYGTASEVADEVKRVIDIMAPGGGFVATTGHNLQADVPLENALALFETIREYGGRPQGASHGIS